MSAGDDSDILACYEEMKHYVLIRVGDKIFRNKLVQYAGRFYEATQTGLRCKHGNLYIVDTLKIDM